MNDEACKSTIEAGGHECRRCVNGPVDFSRLHPDQNLTELEVCQFLRLGRSTLRNKLDKSSPYHDPTFPKQHSLRGEAKKGSAVRWLAGPIMEWNRKQAQGTA